MITDPSLPGTDLTDIELKELLSFSEVALDTETAGLNPWRDPLYLVQICDPGGKICLVKTENWREAKNLIFFLRSDTQKVIHNALFDCCMLMTNTGIEVNNPYCTRLASKISRTYAKSHSLVSNLQDLLNIEIPKEMQSSDWSGELSKSQLEYAKNDVINLLEVKRRQEELLMRRRPLPSGITPVEINRQIQKMIPILVQLKLNGWNLEGGTEATIFGY